MVIFNSYVKLPEGKAYFPNGKATTWESSLGTSWILINIFLGFLEYIRVMELSESAFSVFCWWMLRIHWVNLFYQDFSNYPSWQHAASSVHVLVFFDSQTYSPSNFWGLTHAHRTHLGWFMCHWSSAGRARRPRIWVDEKTPGDDHHGGKHTDYINMNIYIWIYINVYEYIYLNIYNYII